ncbi:MAG: endonuclease V [Thermoguttaceae bacterium]
MRSLPPSSATARFPPVPDLTHCLRQLVVQVPAGRVTTCGDLADALGNRIAAKWVGHFALHHDHDANCPCHRILRAGGVAGAYIAGPSSAKLQRLAKEGVVAKDGLVDLQRFGFRDFKSDRPLEQLRQIQETTQRQILIRPRRRMPVLVGGVDVAYPNVDEGVAAYALVETASGRLVWSTTVRRRVVFPYISTYLSFREIPILLDLLDEVRAAGRMSEILLVDGSGILHHRRAGIASHLGVVASIPTIGVTKKLLCGSVDIEGMAAGESRPVVIRSGADIPVCQDEHGPLGRQKCLPHRREEDRPIGIAIRPTAGSRRPIFVSPGHRVDLPFCEEVVRRLLTGRRLPEPLYWADRLGKKRAGDTCK